MKEDTYSFPEDTITLHPFHLQIAGISYCDGSYRIERNNSPLSAFVYVVQGSGSLFINSCAFTPQKGDLYILPKGSNHLYFSDSHDPWILIWFVAKGSVVEHLLQAYNLENIYYVRECGLEILFDELLLNAQSYKNSCLCVNKKFAILFHEIIIRIAAKINVCSESYSPTAMILKNYLDSHIESSITIKDLSCLIFKSPSQIIRLFKKEFGITPLDYLLKRKIETAKLLLQNTNLSIKEIAYRLKFADEHYFSNYFKLKTGVSPSSFRNQLRSTS